METVKELRLEEQQLIYWYRAKWEAAALSTERIDPENIKSAVQDLYLEMGLSPPRDFAFYHSPAGAWQDFQDWQAKTGSCLVCYWLYHLPIYAPFSYWRQCGDRSEVIDLAIKRKSNAYGCWAYGTPLTDARGKLLDKHLHAAVWKAFDTPIRRDWCSEVIDDLFGRFPEEVSHIASRAAAEDPTNQVTLDEFIYLGPFSWLIQEVACVDFCNKVLGCRRHDKLYQALEVLIHYGSLVMTFEQLCIVCDRPKTILEDSLLVSYEDGYCIKLSPTETYQT